MHDEILAIAIKWGPAARECRELSSIIDQLTRELGAMEPDEGDVELAEPAPALQAPPPLKHELLGDIWSIIQTVDERARDINRRWGTNRLPHLVPLDWLAKFRSQKRKWETACFECAGSPKPEDRDTVRKHGDAMLRAFDKLEELAVAEGHIPNAVSQWEFELRDGTPVILVRDRHEMGQVDAGGRAVQIWSLEEIAHMVEKFPELVRTKELFPGAEVIQVRTDPVVVDELNDSLADLPF